MMAWLRMVRRQIDRRKHEKVLAPADLIELYGIGKQIHYTECWRCWRFIKFDCCMFRYWVRDKLYCILPAKNIDTRLLIGLKQQNDKLNE